MADVRKYLPIYYRVEGGYNPILDGGTNMGITLSTYQSYFGKNKTIFDLKVIPTYQVAYIIKKGYWDKCKADEIKSQAVADIMVDFAVNSGVKTAVKKIQELIGVKADGLVGNITLGAINSYDAKELYNLIEKERIEYYKSLKNKSQYLNGWLERLKKLRKYEEMNKTLK